MPNLVRRCVYTLHFVAASIVGGLLLPVVSAAALAVALVRGPKGHAAVFDARRWILRPGTIRLRVLPPVPTAGLGPGDLDDLMARVRSDLANAQRELAAGADEPILPPVVTPSLHGRPA